MTTLGGVLVKIRDFRDERDWMRFHNPKDMAIAISLAILLDTSGSMRDQMKEVHAAAGSFVDTLRDQDRALVIAFDDKVFLLEENQSTYIPLGVKHRIRNPGKIPLHIIEVQSGTYLGEDDIVRFEDNYGREGTNT